MDPFKFEKLYQRILRELGFKQVYATIPSRDGGIDGKEVFRFGNVLSFHVMFQCKRCKGSISPSGIRDFRGGYDGRAYKGLFITTRSYSGEARKETKKAGTYPINLIDGEQLMDIMQNLKLVFLYRWSHE
jgi:restriction system protein|tara:strand:- start:155 stop:544 length:390 start_codon:yes stop_codon:yes gene_type:complete